VTRILGIDPGKTGAIARLVDGYLTAVVDMPDTIAGIVAALDDLAPIDRAVVERAQAMPSQGIAGTFRYGVHYGSILGVLAARRIPVDTVPPATWKRALGLGSDKTAARRRAGELWPAMAGEFRRVKDDGRAEAALIAHWAHTKGTGA
jgi:hypothetical protein